MPKPLAVAIASGIAAALLMALYLDSLESGYRRGAEKVAVVTAKQYIDPGTVLDGTLVEERLVPKEYLQPRAVTLLKDAVGQDGQGLFMAVVPIEKDEQLVTTKLAPLGIETGIANVLPGERRAVTLPFEGSTVAGIKPGNRVDVIGIFEYEDANSRVQEHALTILQNILVVSVGDSMIGALRPVTGSAKRGEKEPPDFGGGSPDDMVPLSFSVTAKEAEVLTLAAEKGTVKLALRATGDRQLFDTAGVRMRDLVKDITLTAKSERSASAGAPEASLREMRRKQKEIFDLLKKYQK